MDTAREVWTFGFWFALVVFAVCAAVAGVAYGVYLLIVAAVN